MPSLLPPRHVFLHSHRLFQRLLLLLLDQKQRVHPDLERNVAHGIRLDGLLLLELLAVLLLQQVVDAARAEQVCLLLFGCAAGARGSARVHPVDALLALLAAVLLGQTGDFLHLALLLALAPHLLDLLALGERLLLGLPYLALVDEQADVPAFLG
jgi:hypothetical protein